MSALSESASGATLAAVPVALFAALTPSITDVWQSSGNGTTAAMVRHGEILATGVSLMAAAVFAIDTRSVAPLLLTALVCGLIIAVYEHALRKEIR